MLVSHFPKDQQVKKGEIICTKKCKKWVAHTHISIEGMTITNHITKNGPDEMG